MNAYVNPDHLAEVEALAEKLRKLPEAALLYLAGVGRLSMTMTFKEAALGMADMMKKAESIAATHRKADFAME